MEDELKKMRGQVFSLGRELARWREGMKKYHHAVAVLLEAVETKMDWIQQPEPAEEQALRYLRHKALFTPIPNPRDL